MQYLGLEYNELTIEPRICAKILTTRVCTRFCNQMPAGDLNSKIPHVQNFEQAICILPFKSPKNTLSSETAPAIQEKSDQGIFRETPPWVV